MAKSLGKKAVSDTFSGRIIGSTSFLFSKSTLLPKSWTSKHLRLAHLKDVYKNVHFNFLFFKGKGTLTKTLETNSMFIYRGIAKTDTEAAVKNNEKLKKIANYMLLSKNASS